MKLIFMTVRGNISLTDAQDTWTIKQVKDALSSHNGLEASEMIVSCGEKILDNNATLKSYNIKENSKLKIIYKMKGQLNLKIKMSEKEGGTIKIDSSKTVKHLKELIAQSMLKPVANQTLLFGANVILKDDQSLYDIGIGDNSVIVLVDKV